MEFQNEKLKHIVSGISISEFQCSPVLKSTKSTHYKLKISNQDFRQRRQTPYEKFSETMWLTVRQLQVFKSSPIYKIFVTKSPHYLFWRFQTSFMWTPANESDLEATRKLWPSWVCTQYSYIADRQWTLHNWKFYLGQKENSEYKNFSDRFLGAE